MDFEGYKLLLAPPNEEEIESEKRAGDFAKVIGVVLAGLGAWWALRKLDARQTAKASGLLLPFEAGEHVIPRSPIDTSKHVKLERAALAEGLDAIFALDEQGEAELVELRASRGVFAEAEDAKAWAKSHGIVFPLDAQESEAA